MATKFDILSACSKIDSCIMVSVLKNQAKAELNDALKLLHDTALKAVTEQPAQTATQIDDRGRKAEIIAHGDNLEAFAAVMPYLLKRREGARMYMDRPSEGALQYLTAINQKIAEILSIF
jgi:hypothetical protein